MHIKAPQNPFTGLLNDILTIKLSCSNDSELCWGRQKPEKEECDQKRINYMDKLLHHFVLGMCKCFNAQLKLGANMSYFSEPMPISDHHNYHGAPNTGIQCLVCHTWSRVFFFLLLPNSSIPPQTFRSSFGHSFLATPL